MAKKLIPKRTFGTGELDPLFLMRRDTEQFKDGAKTFRNARLLNAGAFTRRPGSYWLATLAGNSILIGFYFNAAQKYILAFSDGRMDAYLEDGTTAGNLTSAPWTANMLGDLRWHVEGDTIFLCHQDMQTQVITRTGAATWDRSAFTFADGFGSATDQPYFKFEDADVTITPSATTGTITVTASASIFSDDWIGVIIRYLDREIEITDSNSATECDATVLQTLPSAQRLTVASSAVFQVGHIVEHSVDGTQAKVFGISDATHVDIIPIDGLQAIPASGNLVGPDGSSAISATASANLPALTDWDEQVFSTLRGFPGVVCLHRERLVFADHPAIQDALMMSRVGNYFNFSLGEANDGDAIFEFIGDGAVDRVRGLVSAENLMILTNSGPYYVPETAGDPITPANINIRPFGSSGVGSAVGGRFAGGVVFPDDSGKRITRIRPSGNTEQPWEAIDVSLLSSHLIRTPVSAAYADKFEDKAERYAFFVNSDGTLAVYQNIEDQNVNGFGLYEGNGEYKSICVVGEDIFFAAERIVNGVATYTLEKMDSELRLDAVKTFATNPGSLTAYAGQTVRVTGDDYDFGEVTVALDGTITVDCDYAGPFEAGYFFAPEVELLPPEIVSDESIAGLMKSYTKIFIHVYESGRYSVNGRSTSSYRGGEDLTAPPPRRTEQKKFSTLGRSYEPELVITQDTAVPLTVLGISTEVSF